LLFESDHINITDINKVVIYSSHQHKYMSFPGKLPTFELAYYLEGETEITFADKTVRMSPGGIVYLPKGLENNVYRADIIKPFTVYNIYFDTPDEMPKEIVRIPTKGDEYKSDFEKIYNTWVGKSE